MAVKILIPHKKIHLRINSLATEIAKTYSDKNMLLLAVLNGSMPTATLLMQALWKKGLRDVELDTISISSYGKSDIPNEPVLKKEPSIPLEKRHVLIVEDIIDTGHTMHFLYKYLIDKKAKSIRTFTLLSKPSKRETPFVADYTGFEIGDEWVEGFGLDTNQKGRGNPDIIKK